jgi:acyl-CoA synthetase (AMP-forming)/AMP-acid ligase II
MEVNLSTLVRTMAASVADHDALVRGHDRWSYRQLIESSDQFSRVLAGAGVGWRRSRLGLRPWESGQDHVALVLRNRPELIEAMLGTFAARAAPFTVNYRYGPEELGAVLADAQARAVVFESADAPVVALARRRLGDVVLLQVDDGSGGPLLDGARWYHAAVGVEPIAPLPLEPSPDDLYLLFTGGTTDRPKGVLWRQADLFPAALGGRDPHTGREHHDVATIVAAARAGTGRTRVLVAAPLAHGTAQWVALNALAHGHTVVLPGLANFDARDTLEAVEQHAVGVVLIVGDAFARPLLDELDRRAHDVSSVALVVSGGAALSAPVKRALLERMPGIAVLDSLGASESGLLASHVASTSQRAPSGRFSLRPGAAVLSADRQRVLAAGDDELGWLAQSGRIPLGYLGDPEGTARTFPTVEGTRFAVPGDRVRRVGADAIELHGRDAATINSGGQKVFAEEVEAALVNHRAVEAAVVTGRPSARWGEEVVAIVERRVGHDVTADELRAECANHIADFKRPKAVIFVEHIPRSPAGKPDYRWARAVASGSPIEEDDAGTV